MLDSTNRGSSRADSVGARPVVAIAVSGAAASFQAGSPSSYPTAYVAQNLPLTAGLSLINHVTQNHRNLARLSHGCGPPRSNQAPAALRGSLLPPPSCRSATDNEAARPPRPACPAW